MESHGFGHAHLDIRILHLHRLDFGRQSFSDKVAGDKKIRRDNYTRRALLHTVRKGFFKRRLAVVEIADFNNGRVTALAHSLRQMAQVLARAAEQAAMTEENNGVFYDLLRFMAARVGLAVFRYSAHAHDALCLLVAQRRQQSLSGVERS